MAGWEVEKIGNCTLYRGDALEIIPTMGSIDALVTDPPYSSGGQFRGDRMQKTAAKYVRSDSLWTNRDEFAGDTRDQRAFLAWATMWLSKVYYLATPGAICCLFTDWRPITHDD